MSHPWPASTEGNPENIPQEVAVGRRIFAVKDDMGTKNHGVCRKGRVKVKPASYRVAGAPHRDGAALNRLTRTHARRAKPHSTFEPSTSPNIAGSLVVANADESRVSEHAVRRPLDERHLNDRHRLDPSQRGHVSFGDPLSPVALAGAVRQVDEWARLGGPVRDAREHLGSQMWRESSPDLPGEVQPATLVVADQNRIEVRRRWVCSPRRQIPAAG